MAGEPVSVDLTVKWSGKEYKITELSETKTVKDLKLAIFNQTKVLPERQKLLGLKYKGSLSLSLSPYMIQQFKMIILYCHRLSTSCWLEPKLWPKACPHLVFIWDLKSLSCDN